MPPKFRPKGHPNHSGADDGLHVWERPNPLEDVPDEEVIEMINALTAKKSRRQKKR